MRGFPFVSVVTLGAASTMLILDAACAQGGDAPVGLGPGAFSAATSTNASTGGGATGSTGAGGAAGTGGSSGSTPHANAGAGGATSVVGAGGSGTVGAGGSGTGGVAATTAATSTTSGTSGGTSGTSGTTSGSTTPSDCAQASGMVGCCAGNTLYYCKSGSTSVASEACKSGESCGWEASKNYYGCVSGAATPDPSGTYPIACP
jgi:hypothetical protein